MSYTKKYSKKKIYFCESQFPKVTNIISFEYPFPLVKRVTGQERVSVKMIFRGRGGGKHETNCQYRKVDKSIGPSGSILSEK